MVIPMVKNRKTRSLLVRGAKALALSSVLLAFASCSHGKTDTDEKSSKLEVTTTCTTSTTTCTSSTSTTLSTTVSIMTTTSTAEIVSTIPPATTTPTIVVATEPITEYIEPVYTDGLPITERERVLLCNVVANEYGSDWVSVYDKACVVATYCD